MPQTLEWEKKYRISGKSVGGPGAPPPNIVKIKLNNTPSGRYNIQLASLNY